MDVVTYVRNDERDVELVGALVDGDIVDLHALAPGLPDNALDVLRLDPAGRPSEAELRDAERIPIGSVTLLPPVPRPGKIVCIGVNYAAHADETGSERAKYPTVFAKFSNVLIGHGADIVVPTACKQPDYEGELAVIIGQPCSRVTKGEALQYVCGYAPFNDVSARDYQGHTSQWVLGKSPDTFGPFGPAVTTADAVGRPDNLTLRTFVNDEQVQLGDTADLIFSIPEIIEYLSSVMTLDPGDVIATGTPSGVGAARDPQYFLKDGDRVRVQITGLPELENSVCRP
jgi:acylpyruvate hydrolase